MERTHRLRKRVPSGLVSHPNQLVPLRDYILNLPPGKITLSRVNTSSTLELIASVFKVPVSSIVVEPFLTGEVHRARFLITPEPLLQEVRFYQGITLDHETGWLTIGRHADGEPARWQFWVPGSGACRGLICGAPGTGKSVLLTLLLAEARHSGIILPWLIDPDDGASVGDWQDGVDWFAGTPAEARRLLQGAERVMDARRRTRGRRVWVDDLGRQRRGLREFTPTAEEPMILVIIDEAPDVLVDPECARIVARLGKKGRKYGIGIVLIAQVPSVVELGGNSTIRSVLSDTNIAVFRTGDTVSKHMAVPSDLPIDPASLPAVWPDGTTTQGLSYLASPGAARMAPMRIDLQDDTYHWATTGSPATADPITKQAAGQTYLTWRQRREQGEDDDSDDFDGATEPMAASFPEQVAEINSTSNAILAHLSKVDSAHLGVIADAIKRSKPATSNAIKRLNDRGEIRFINHGIWALAEATEPDKEEANDQMPVLVS